MDRTVFALFVDLTDRVTVVIGGGSVGRRKAKALLDAGAIVRLVCLEEPPGDFTAPRLIWLREPYHLDHLAGASLVFACADPALNRRVANDARRRGIWVNCADDPAAGDFVLPAMLRRGELVVAVSTGGAAPTLAKRLRDRLEPQFDQAHADWVAILKELRSLARTQLPDETQRRALLERWCEAHWLERLRQLGREAVQAEMLQELHRVAAGLIE